MSETTVQRSQPIDILCFRYGETPYNKQGKIQGQTERGSDTQLNGTGQEQAEKTGKFLSELCPGITTIYTSPAERCKETAQRVATYFRNAVIIPRDELKGINHGLHDGMDFKLRNLLCEQYYARVLENTSKDSSELVDPFVKWKLNPLSGAETYYQVWERATKALIDIAEEHSKKLKEKAQQPAAVDTPKENEQPVSSPTEVSVATDPFAVAWTTVSIQALISRAEYEYKGSSAIPLPLFFELQNRLPNGAVARLRYHPDEPKFERKLEFIRFENP